MRLKSLKLEQYRNIEQLSLATDAKVNIFVGDNAQGKTNILESIFALALARSHRTNKDKELIRFGAERALLSAEVDKKYGNTRLELQIGKQGKTAKVNGLEQRKLSGFIGALNVVMFAPEDLEIVKGSPSIRRKFMDMEIGQVHPSYLYDLSQYQKIIQQKNNLFKKFDAGSQSSSMMLDVWNEQQAAIGVKIMKSRQNFIQKVQRWAEAIHSGITNGREKLRIVYRPSVEFDENQDDSVVYNQFMIKLSQARGQEERRGVCLVGPHRDDLSFYIDDKDVQAFGSQGQQRTAALSLKLAELELMREEVGEYPVLLLDDVLSELDRNRQSQLIDTFQGKVQTFITTTGIESIDSASLQDARLYRVRGGEVADIYSQGS